jgi:signal transduction histidine kinase
VKSRKFDITPDIRLLVDIGEANYEVPQAISELIANSMDARFDEEKVNVEVLINDEFISITDNGKGMSENVLAEALRLAAQMDSVTGNTKARKGMYGLGLKAACASLGTLGNLYQTTQRLKSIFSGN